MPWKSAFACATFGLGCASFDGARSARLLIRANKLHPVCPKNPRELSEGEAESIIYYQPAAHAVLVER